MSILKEHYADLRKEIEFTTETVVCGTCRWCFYETIQHKILGVVRQSVCRNRLVTKDPEKHIAVPLTGRCKHHE